MLIFAVDAVDPAPFVSYGNGDLVGRDPLPLGYQNLTWQFLLAALFFQNQFVADAEDDPVNSASQTLRGTALSRLRVGPVPFPRLPRVLGRLRTLVQNQLREPGRQPHSYKFLPA